MYNSIMMAEFEQLLKKKDINVIDVREDDEFESGHIKTAKHIALGTIPENLDKLDDKEEYYVICYSGARSARASMFLGNKCYKVTNVMGGMSAYRGELEFGR